MINATKIWQRWFTSFLCSIWSTECSNARTWKIWLDGKLREVYATNEFGIVRRRH